MTIGGAAGQANTVYEHDPNGNTIAVVGPTQNQRLAAKPATRATAAYDPADRVITSVAEDGAATTHGYDANGNRTCTQRPRGNSSAITGCRATSADVYSTGQTAGIAPLADAVERQSDRVAAEAAGRSPGASRIGPRVAWG